MLTDPKLRSQIDALWEELWAVGLANSLDAINPWFPYEQSRKDVILGRFSDDEMQLSEVLENNR